MHNGVGIILAGGKATRLGGISKADIVIGGKTCLQHAKDILEHELSTIALASSKSCDMVTISDWPHKGRGGVAYAVLGALHWTKTQGYDFMITLPVDTPFITKSYVNDLTKNVDSSRRPVVYKSGGKIQALHALWPVACLDEMKFLILETSDHKISSLHIKLESRTISCEIEDYDPFLNLNTHADLKSASCLAQIFQL